MSARYFVRLRAELDIADIAAYLARQSPEVACQFYDATTFTFEQLAESAEMGEVVRISNRRFDGLRAWQVRGFRNHIIYYFPVDGGIDVVRVLHAARDRDAVLE